MILQLRRTKSADPDDENDTELDDTELDDTEDNVETAETDAADSDTNDSDTVDHSHDAPTFSASPVKAIVAATIAGALVLVLAAVAIGLLIITPDAPSYDKKATFNALERDAVLAARQEVLKLTTLSATSADKQIKSLLADATGSFRDSLSQIATQLKAAVVQQKVTATGKITEAGVVSSDPGKRTVTVLVSAMQEVKNAAAPTGEPRNYRLTVTMQKVKKRLLVADLGFVQ